MHREAPGHRERLVLSLVDMKQHLELEENANYLTSWSEDRVLHWSDVRNEL